ncbi:hypothetical protein PSH28_22585 [Pseudomonas resinovorans]|uniref:hypothetical protein n=1 Tax=Metapseudomonas resinovorans TaxID=53412 RepID=UPI00237EF259|nr:hypothetical protein [Pseudomonas resinovorans]MDE3739401.1 hypothetical protein [Pseudomonas resinovorans]
MKVTSAALKFSIALGGACVILYSIRIGHFPQGLALGDGLLFLLAAGCFGFMYAIFVAGLIGLGSCLSPVTNRVLKFSSWIMTKLRGKKTESLYELEPFQWAAVPFAFLALVMIGGLGQQDHSVYLKLLAVAVMLHFLYSVVIDTGRKLRAAEKLQGTVIETPDKAKASTDADKYKNVYLIVCFLMVLMPLLLGGVSGQLVDGAMRLANVRIDEAVIYTKAPYDALLPDSLIAKDLKSPEGYKAYKGISVRFKGFGSTTVIAFKDGVATRQLEIPNDQIIVEKQTTKRT